MANKRGRGIVNAKIVKISSNSMVIKYKGDEYLFNYFLPQRVEPKKAYVYFVFVNNELLYIGKGTGDRYKHTESESTHSGFIRKQVKLSKESPDEFRLRTYIIFDQKDSRSAYAIESKYIKIFKPRGNIEENPLYKNTKKGRKRLASELLSNRDDSKQKCDKTKIAANKKIRSVQSRAKARQMNYVKNSYEFGVRDLDLQHLFWLRDNGY